MMKWWAFAKQAPKYALVLGIIVGSSALFVFWWKFLRAGPQPPPRDNSAELASIRERAAKAEARIDYLFLADDDLYDAGTGECLFKNWLHGDHPNHLFYDAKSKKIICRYDQGFARYTFDGNRDATMMLPQTPPALVPDSKKIVFAKGKDIWTAEIDWDAFKFVNERQVTTMGVFYDQHFHESVALLTEKTLVVRNGNNLLRVNLENGNVKPLRVPLGDIGRRRSPDSKWVTGAMGGQFYCYDVDADDAKTIPVGRTGLSEFQWLTNDKCVCLAENKKVLEYDRPTHTLTESATLPFSCFRMGEPSPDSRYIFCGGGINARNGALVDFNKRAATPVNGGDGITWVSNDTFAFSRDVPDSEKRGTFLQSMGQSERMITRQPSAPNGMQTRYVVLESIQQFLFTTQQGVCKVHLATDETQYISSSDRQMNLRCISEWTTK